MKPKQISYSESRESVDAIGLKSWRKAGVDIELDGDDIDKAYEEARQIVGKALQPVTINPEFAHFLNGLPQTHPPTQTLPTIDYSSKEKTEKAIEEAKTLEGLNKVMNDAFLNGFTEEFIAKKKKLQQ